MIAHGLSIYMAREPVDMRLGSEHLGPWFETGCARSHARGRCLCSWASAHGMTVLTWNGTGVIVVHKKLDAGRFELPRATQPGELLVSDARFDVIHKAVVITPRAARRRIP